jgi:transposase
MPDMVRVEDALKHMGGVEVPEEPPKQEFEGRERLVKRPHELAERRMQMAAMFAKGKYLTTIAKHFGVSAITVGKEINKLVAEYQEEAKGHIGEKIAKEELLLYMVQLEAINAWFESKEGKIVNTHKRALQIKSVGKQFGNGRKGKQMSQAMVKATILQELDSAFGDPEPTDEMRVTNRDENEEEWDKHETSSGDPRFLSIILDCHDRRAKLFGLYPKIDKEGLSLDDDETLQLDPQKRASLLRNYLDKARQKRSHQLALKSADASVTVEKINRAPLGSTHKEEQSIFEKRAIEVTARHVKPTPTPIDYGEF